MYIPIIQDSYFSGWDDHTLPLTRSLFRADPKTHTRVSQVVESVEDLLASIVHIKPLQVGPTFGQPQRDFVTNDAVCVCFAVLIVGLGFQKSAPKNDYIL